MFTLNGMEIIKRISNLILDEIFYITEYILKVIKRKIRTTILDSEETSHQRNGFMIFTPLTETPANHNDTKIYKLYAFILLRRILQKHCRWLESFSPWNCFSFKTKGIHNIGCWVMMMARWAVSNHMGPTVTWPRVVSAGVGWGWQEVQCYRKEVPVFLPWRATLPLKYWHPTSFKSTRTIAASLHPLPHLLPLHQHPPYFAGILLNPTSRI